MNDAPDVPFNRAGKLIARMIINDNSRLSTLEVSRSEIEWQRQINHACEKGKLTPIDSATGNVAKGRWNHSHPSLFTPPTRVILRHNQLIAWLEDIRLRYIPLSNNTTAVTTKRGDLQKQAIIEKLERLGVNPHALPRNKPGRSGIKSLVYKNIKADSENTGLFASQNTFEKRWERLRSDGSLKDAPP